MIVSFQNFTIIYFSFLQTNCSQLSKDNEGKNFSCFECKKDLCNAAQCPWSKIFLIVFIGCITILIVIDWTKVIDNSKKNIEEINRTWLVLTNSKKIFNCNNGHDAFGVLQKNTSMRWSPVFMIFHRKNAYCSGFLDLTTKVINMRRRCTKDKRHFFSCYLQNWKQQLILIWKHFLKKK